MSPIRRWGRRLAYFLIALLWLAVMLFPIFAFRLATAGEIVLGDNPQRQTRFFLIQERDAEGISIERSRPATETDSVTYVETTLTYLMWVGEAENNRFCQQFDRDSGAFLGAEPGPCPANIP